MFESEYEAFKVYAEIYPQNCTLLVDTYNVLRSGVPNAIRVFDEILKPKGVSPKGIRIDSGDIAYLSKKARAMLDEAGYQDVKITASNSLDEYIIRDLLVQEARIDAFGVGEKLITSKSEPVFGGVYKLAAIEKDGEYRPKIKLSETVEKITTPGFKNVFRIMSKDTGMAIADYVTSYDEEIDESRPLELFDPGAVWKRQTVAEFTAQCLLVPIFKGGKKVYQAPELSQVRSHCLLQVDRLWDEVKRFENPHRYYVDLSRNLWDIRQRELMTVERNI